jgi:hypothetical protein
MNRTARPGDTVAYRNADGETANVLVLAAQLAAPSNTLYSTTPSAAGGTLASATYSYRVSVVVGGLESLAGTAKTAVVTGPTGSVTIDATALLAAYPTATSWKVYGRVGGSELLITTRTSAQPTYVDNNALTPAGALPVASTDVQVRNPSTHTLITPVAKATLRTDVNAYFNR